MIVPTTLLMMISQVSLAYSFAFLPLPPATSTPSVTTARKINAKTSNYKFPSFLQHYGGGSTITSSTSSFLLHSTTPNNNNNNNNDNNIDVIKPLPQILRFRGQVATGYGRGGKKLGVPTANLPASLFSDALKDIDTGVYFGWALIEGSQQQQEEERRGGRNVVQKAVVNIGYSPTFEGKENAEKIIEAHIIIDSDDDDDVPIEGDFYGEVMRIQLIGSLRPEMKFPSFGELVQAIQNDIKCAKEALGEERFLEKKKDEFLKVVVREKEEGGVWVGKSGGDEDASWEFQDL